MAAGRDASMPSLRRICSKSSNIVAMVCPAGLAKGGSVIEWLRSDLAPPGPWLPSQATPPRAIAANPLAGTSMARLVQKRHRVKNLYGSGPPAVIMCQRVLHRTAVQPSARRHTCTVK